MTHPSPKKKYGFDMANNGPYLAHTWNRYGKVRPLYGTDMGPSFVTFQGMGRVWVFSQREALYGFAMGMGYP